MKHFALLLFPLLAAAQSEQQSLALLKQRCGSCHSSATQSGGLSVDSKAALLKGGKRGPAILPGHAAESPLIRFLKGTDKPRMPLGADPLPAAEIAALEQWIASLPAAPTSTAQPWWSFRPLTTPPVPSTNSAWATNEIDHFILAKLSARQLAPSPQADRRLLARRVYLDLTGLPPTPEELAAFLNNPAPDAYEKLIDALLNSPRFGERWGRHWLDLVRYADTQGFEADRENYTMWRYRDYVIRAFNQDKPYNTFLTEQIAGDEIPNATEDALLATGFLRLTPRFGTTNAQQFRQMNLDEITATVGSAFLGLTMKCAQCHDHRYDPIPQKDFYRLQAFFATIEMTDARVPYSDPAVRARMERSAAEAREKLNAAQKRFDDYQRGMLERLRTALGKPAATASNTQATVAADDEIVTGGFLRKLTPDVADLERRITRAIANGVVPNPDDTIFTNEEKTRYIDLLSYVDGNRGGRDLGVYQRELRRYQPIAHIVRNIPNSGDRPFLPVTFVRIKGEFDKPGEIARPGFPIAITGKEEDAALTTDAFGNQRGWRMPLAQWITHRNNPLTARVMTNRIWQHLFGHGIVDTPSDFGRNGAAPTHPELLDWLATRFIEDNWSMKKTIRRILLSSTYRQSSIRDSARENKEDPNNTLLWRQNRRRLEGDILRDVMLSTTGSLHPEAGGPGVFVPLPAAMKERMTIKNIPSWTPTTGPEKNRRSIYVFQRRQLEVPFLATFDAAVLQFSCERRTASTTALQALTLLNDELIVEHAGALAERIRAHATSDNNQITAAFQQILGRAPSPQEQRDAQQLLRTSSLASLARLLLNTNEVLYVD
ncbi:MAG: PSD1 and planctomycete cytochrome C domain-containing protein [Bryobacteraceae bacterium]